MGVTCATTRVVAQIAGGNQDITTADLGGLTPTAVFFTVTYGESDGVAANHAVFGLGAADDDGNEWAIGCAMQHNVTPTNSKRYGRSDICIMILDPTNGPIDGTAAYVAMIANGVRINWTDAPAAGYYIQADFYAGTDVLAHAGHFTLGNQDVEVNVNTVGFQPEAILPACSHQLAAAFDNNFDTYGRMAHGIVTEDGGVTQSSSGIYDIHGNAASSVAGRVTATYGILSVNWNGTLVWGGDFGNFDAQGFSCWSRTANSNEVVCYLALSFSGAVQYASGIIDSPIAGGNASWNDPAFEPQMVRIGLTQMPLLDTAYTADGGSFGACTFDEDDEYCHSIQDEHNVNPTDTQSLSDDTAINFPDDDGTASWVASYVAFIATGWTLNFTGFEGTAVKWWYLAIGAGAPTPDPTPTTPITGAYAPCRWQVVVPEATTNLIAHPNVEDAAIAGFVPVNAATRVRSTTQSRWGLYSLGITPNAVNVHSGVYYEVTGAATTTYTFSVWILGTIGAIYNLRILDGLLTELAVQAFTATGSWQRIDVTGTTAANAVVRCYLTANAAGGAIFFADGWQLEVKTHRTTYCDGERDGCEWTAAPHISTSSRSAQSRAGGRVRDLETVYGLNISGMSDFGVAPTSLTVDEYAILPGGEQSGAKIHPRSFIVSGTIVGTSLVDYHSRRQVLATLFDPEAYPGEQPVLLRYTGAVQEREIAVHYQDGLEASVRAEEPCWWERVAIRFMAPEPFWYEVGETSWLLDHTDPLTFRYIAGRLRSTGQWDDLGLGANPGANGPIYAMAWGPDGRLYVGGDFTGLNGTGGAASIDYVGVWDPLTDTWAMIGTAAGDLTADVYALAFDSTGLLHVGGAFINVGGGATDLDYIVTWDGTAWGALGSPGEADERVIYDMAWDSFGDLYVVGVFENWAGVGSDYVARWDGIAWNMVGDPDVGTAAIVHIRAIVIDSTDRVFVGGNFVDFNNDGDADYIAQYTIAENWTALGTLVLDSRVNALALRPEDDSVYAGGLFTTFGATAMSKIGLWTGTNWEPLAGGMTGGDVYSLRIGPDGILFIGGDFTHADALALNDGITRWNGSVYSHLDADFQGVPISHVIEMGSVDPIVGQNYDIFIGLSTTGAGVLAGTTGPINAGTELMFPSIKINRTGGTVARLQRIRNETMGREMLCDYALLDDETLTIDLEPTEKRITSSFFGSRPDAVQASSDFGSFALQVGSNQITCFIDVIGAAVVAWMVGRTIYAGQD